MKHLCLLVLTLSFWSCASQNIQNYAGEKPQLLLEEFFNGEFKAYGLVQNRSGEVTRRFVVNLRTQWKNNVGTLQEDFVWSDGEKS